MGPFGDWCVLRERQQGMAMEIRRLADGEPAPANGDCVNVDPADGGKFSLRANALCGDEMVSLIGTRELFDTREAAEEQGLAWADAQGAETVYLTFGAPTPGD